MTSDDTDADRVLDAREIDGEPFSDIMNELEALEDGETLLLINSFERPRSMASSRKGLHPRNDRGCRGRVGSPDRTRLSLNRAVRIYSGLMSSRSRHWLRV
ncbi:DUF2249 domain-containing protein [Saliphagus sp. GCM10025308]